MKSNLPAAHLLRQFLLFALVVVFLLTLVRASYALWHFPQLEQTDAFVALFLQGLRFDLSLLGLICIVPAVLGSLLSMFRATRVIAKWLVGFFLVGGLILILLSELVTPWFLENMGVRPDLSLLQSVESPLQTLKEVFANQLIPLVIASVLCLLVLIAYLARMELGRFLRFPISKSGGMMVLVGVGFLSALAIRSKLDFTTSAMGPADAQISTDATINDIAMNSAYKILHSLAAPFLN